jgi:predicted DNA-binding protein (UPF0278 family)
VKFIGTQRHEGTVDWGTVVAAEKLNGLKWLEALSFKTILTHSITNY